MTRAPRRHPDDREILRLAVPALGALLAEPLFLLADSAIVGHLGTPQLAGLGIAGAVLATAVYLCVFLAYGTTAAVARRLGAGDLAGALRQGVDGIWLGFGVGVALAVAGAPLTPGIVGWLGGEGEVAGYARTYLWTSLPGLPAMLVVLAATGVLRGLQDTRTPLVVAVVAAAANAVLNVVLVYGMGLGIAGSALGTVLAQYGMAAAFVVVVVRGTRRHGVSLRPDGAGVRAAASTGAPLFLRTLSMRVVLLAATAVATHLGPREVAAHQVAFAIWTFLALGLDALAIAGQAVVGRCLGAGDVPAARAATRRVLRWSVLAGVGTGLAVVAARHLIAPLFTPDADLRALLADVLVVAGVLQPIAGAVFALDGVLIGAGDGRYLAWAGLATMAAFLAAAAILVPAGTGLLGLWAAIGVFMVARLAALAPRAAGDAWLVTGAAVPRGRR